MDFKVIYEQAVMAGQIAQQQYLTQHGEDAYCGFGWVEIPNGRSPFVNWCRKNGVGKKHWHKGWCIWRPTGLSTQSMTIQEVGAEAFVEVLRNHGIDAWACSRAD
jgi:hypothetical protein